MKKRNNDEEQRVVIVRRRMLISRARSKVNSLHLPHHVSQIPAATGSASETLNEARQLRPFSTREPRSCKVDERYRRYFAATVCPWTAQQLDAR